MFDRHGLAKVYQEQLLDDGEVGQAPKTIASRKPGLVSEAIRKGLEVLRRAPASSERRSDATGIRESPA